MRYAGSLAAFAVLLVVAGCAGAPPRADTGLAIHLASPDEEPGWAPIKDPVDGEKLFMAPEPVLTGADILNARAMRVQAVTANKLDRSESGSSLRVKQAEPRPGVAFRLSRSALSRLRREMKAQGCHRLAIRVKERLIATPTVREAVRDMLIVGDFTASEAEALAAALNGQPGPDGGTRFGW